MNANEVAKLLGMHPNSIRRLIREGKIKAEKKGRSYEIPQSEIAELRNNRDMKELGQAQENAAYQLIANVESEIEAVLHHIQFNARHMEHEMEARGASVDLLGYEVYKKRREIYENDESSSLRWIVESVVDLKRLERLRDDLREIAKKAEQHNSEKKASEYLKELRADPFEHLMEEGDEDS